jgi:hypothetical protein
MQLQGSTTPDPSAVPVPPFSRSDRGPVTHDDAYFRDEHHGSGYGSSGQYTQTPDSYGKGTDADAYRGMTPDMSQQRVQYDPTSEVGATPWSSLARLMAGATIRPPRNEQDAPQPTGGVRFEPK